MDQVILWVIAVPILVIQGLIVALFLVVCVIHGWQCIVGERDPEEGFHGPYYSGNLEGVTLVAIILLWVVGAAVVIYGAYMIFSNLD